MLDLLGVGICIACISYLCCIYTTSLVTLSSSMDSRNKSKRQRCRRGSKPVEAEAGASLNCSTTASFYSGASARYTCPCVNARCLEQDTVAVPSRRKVCLVASSFLNFDDTDTDGKCKRSDEGLCYCSDKSSFSDFRQRRECKTLQNTKTCEFIEESRSVSITTSI